MIKREWLRKKRHIWLSLPILMHACIIIGYGLPGVNLGYTNILDGGPIRPNPGFYFQEYSIFYHTKKFLDGCGRPLMECPPAFNSWTSVNQFIYQGKKEYLNRAVLGFSAVVPITLYSHIQDNELQITSAGGGFGNISFGGYIQWLTHYLKQRPFFIHRISLDLGTPSLVNKQPRRQINPGVDFFYLVGSWSATMYLTQKLATSWRINYLWSAHSRHTEFQAGDVMYINYSLEYPVIPKLYLAAAGYYLQQLHNNKVAGITVPNSKTRLLGFGPAAAYFFSQDLIFFGYLYGEFGARNSQQGVSFVLRLVKHF